MLNIYNNKFKDYDNKLDYFYSYKYNQFNIGIIPNKYDYIFISKNNDLYNQEFINIYLKDLFIKYNKKIIKGNIEQLNIDIINNIDVQIPPIEIQNNFITYYNNIKNINILKKNQISILENIKKYTIEKYINNSSKKELSNICTISNEGTKNTIYIYKNSSLAGNINLTLTNEKNTNNYYLHIINKNMYNQNYIYFILLYYQQLFINNANNTNTICLSKKFVETFLIPDIIFNLQIKLVDEINKINTNIYNYIANNTNNILQNIIL